MQHVSHLTPQRAEGGSDIRRRWMWWAAGEELIKQLMYHLYISYNWHQDLNSVQADNSALYRLTEHRCSLLILTFSVLSHYYTRWSIVFCPKHYLFSLSLSCLSWFCSTSSLSCLLTAVAVLITNAPSSPIRWETFSQLHLLCSLLSPLVWLFIPRSARRLHSMMDVAGWASATWGALGFVKPEDPEDRGPSQTVPARRSLN